MISGFLHSFSFYRGFLCAFLLFFDLPLLWIDCFQGWFFLLLTYLKGICWANVWHKHHALNMHMCKNFQICIFLLHFSRCLWGFCKIIPVAAWVSDTHKHTPPTQHTSGSEVIFKHSNLASLMISRLQLTSSFMTVVNVFFFCRLQRPAEPVKCKNSQVHTHCFWSWNQSK